MTAPARSGVLDRTFDLFDRLGASERQLDFPVVYTSALRGYAHAEGAEPGSGMDPLLEVIVAHTPPPPVDAGWSIPDADKHPGLLTLRGPDRHRADTARGGCAPIHPVVVLGREGERRSGRVLEVMRAQGLERRKVEEAQAGEIVALSGIDALRVSDTLCDPATVEALPALRVDEPTVRMTFAVNTSPFAGRDGRFVTGRHLRERLRRELIHNVALRVEESDNPDRFQVSGRGELHLGHSHREHAPRRLRARGRLSRSHSQDGGRQGVRALRASERRRRGVAPRNGHGDAGLAGAARSTTFSRAGRGRTRLDYLIPARALIGLRTEFLSGHLPAAD